jgi:hypothetical protein
VAFLSVVGWEQFHGISHWWRVIGKTTSPPIQEICSLLLPVACELWNECNARIFRKILIIRWADHEDIG